MFWALATSVAPIRGWADPNYHGFSFGLIRVEPGPGVTLVAGTVFVLAVASMCIALLDLRGRPQWLVAGFDGLMALNLGVSLAVDLATRPEMMKIQLGEYLTLGPVPAALVLSLIGFVPLTLAAVWAWHRRASVRHGS